MTSKNQPIRTINKDEFLVLQKHYSMAKEFMLTTSIACEVCNNFSLMEKIKKY